MATNPELDKLDVNNQQAESPSASITLNINEINVVLAALQELPHRVADPILKKIIQQAQDQVK